MSSETTNRHHTTETETTGHSWDGIEELNNPLPRWWVWVFYATILWGVIYTIAYPAWPLVNRATAGVLGFSTRADVAAEIAAVDARNAELVAQLAAAEPSAIAGDETLQSFAVNAGAAIFRANCSQCHGAGAAGVQAAGFPNLLDDDWLWGGSMDDIVYTVTHGIRNEQSPDARWVEMPAFGDILSREEIASVVAHVRGLSGQEVDQALAAAGETVFLDNCAACHGDSGEGMPEMGAPQLNDAIWLYGGSEAAVTETVRNARFGVMPAWSEEYRVGTGLSQAEINAVAAYVHQLGGGE
ncbi:cytochrome-c oxidase, cbb3-type subunit III [Wenxinia marina]|uniref:Cbb3-type cytochrome c oxidase subunit n=1 Tax=Wenxinia marina DSM 24838 TaxID=1123501 RepID=A0A0D0QIP3_9RHOB|nr:cytochrome-c oxidase, cbb3-type subunit III [Wenxinia marina]KIQ70933.1 cytochrome c oxidase, cbb3-type, subunit III [Wenxinia marina DSM 24838]GGL56195.1 Cbb3-type cytochrome c oxidase subunit CcoP [Wenxinia marina]